MAKNKRTVVEYLLEFIDPIPWRNLSDFERDFAIFFNEHGVEAEISGLYADSSGRKIITLTRKEMIDPKQMMTQPTEIKKMKDQFKNLKNPTGKKVGK